jgi:hypothetical protein
MGRDSSVSGASSFACAETDAQTTSPEPARQTLVRLRVAVSGGGRPDLLDSVEQGVRSQVPIAISNGPSACVSAAAMDKRVVRRSFSARLSFFDTHCRWPAYEVRTASKVSFETISL